MFIWLLIKCRESITNAIITWALFQIKKITKLTVIFIQVSILMYRLLPSCWTQHNRQEQQCLKLLSESIPFIPSPSKKFNENQSQDFLTPRANSSTAQPFVAICTRPRRRKDSGLALWRSLLASWQCGHVPSLLQTIHLRQVKSVVTQSLHISQEVSLGRCTPGSLHLLHSEQELLLTSHHGYTVRYFRYSFLLWQWKHKGFIIKLKFIHCCKHPSTKSMGQFTNYQKC